MSKKTPAWLPALLTSRTLTCVNTETRQISDDCVRVTVSNETYHGISPEAAAILRVACLVVQQAVFYDAYENDDDAEFDVTLSNLYDTAVDVFGGELTAPVVAVLTQTLPRLQEEAHRFKKSSSGRMSRFVIETETVILNLLDVKGEILFFFYNIFLQV